MSESFVDAAKKLLAGDDAGASTLTTRAVQAVEQLATHLAPLVGETGVRALLARSVALASQTFPWIAGTIPIVRTAEDAPWSSLRSAMVRQDPEAICGGFALLLSTFFGLLGRLVGEHLVAHLMHDVWPALFPYDVKEAT